LALSRYLDQLDPAQISFAVKQRRPKSLTDTVSSTIEFEFYLPKDQPVRAVIEASLEQSITMTPRAQAVNEQSLLQHLLNRIEKLKITQPQHDAQIPP